MNVDDKGPVIALPQTLDLAVAERFLADLCRRIPTQGPARLDASAVEVMTLPCTQIIMAATATNDQVTIVNPSEAFAATLADFGVSLAWEIDETLPAVEDAPVLGSPEPDSSTLADVEDAPAAVEAEPQAPAAGVGAGKRIMTIDDSKTMRDMLMLSLAEAGFDVLQAVDGQDGVEKLAREDNIDVVITDINMPRMDGYDVIRALRKMDKYKSTPILCLTTESETDKKNLAREAGATGWMVKPFDPEKLVATVLKVAP